MTNQYIDENGNTFSEVAGIWENDKGEHTVRVVPSHKSAENWGMSIAAMIAYIARGTSPDPASFSAKMAILAQTAAALGVPTEIVHIPPNDQGDLN